jgi:ketosteroid isomerase-like protein
VVHNRGMARRRGTRDQVGRSLEERVALRLPPPVFRAALTRAARLPTGSRLRQRLLKRAATRGFAASNRGDYEVALLLYEPDVTIEPVGEVAHALGLADTYHGHQGFVAVWRDYQQDTEGLRIDIEQLVDRSDRIALRVTLIARGRVSGAPWTRPMAFIYYLSQGGKIARQEFYLEWADALAALDGRAP